MPERTSIDAERTVSSTDGLSAESLLKRRPRRRIIFSTSTTASSTSPPMAIAIPPSVMVLIDWSKSSNTIPVIKMDSGIEVSAMSAGRTEPKKAYKMMPTQKEARINLYFSVVIDASIKLACLKVICGFSIPAGRFLAISFKAFSIS